MRYNLFRIPNVQMGFQTVFASFSFVSLFMYPYGMEGMGAEGKREKTKIIPEKTSTSKLERTKKGGWGDMA